MRYKIYTYPACEKCADVKRVLSGFEGEEINVGSKEGVQILRNDFEEYGLHEKVKRNEDGSLPIPLVIFFSDKNIIGVVSDINKIKEIIQ